MAGNVKKKKKRGEIRCCMVYFNISDSFIQVALENKNSQR